MSFTIQEVKKKHEACFLSMPGVISVGIGLNKDKIPAIIIGLRHAKPDIISGIPAVLEGYPVEVQIIGSIKAL